MKYSPAAWAHAAEFPLLSIGRFGLLDADMQHRANTDLNRGDAHHAVKNALRIVRQGEISDRSSEGQHYAAGLNLLAAIVIYWNTAHLGEAVRQRNHAGPAIDPELFARLCAFLEK